MINVCLDKLSINIKNVDDSFLMVDADYKLLKKLNKVIKIK
jgi:hypothetical protein